MFKTLKIPSSNNLIPRYKSPKFKTSKIKLKPMPGKKDFREEGKKFEKRVKRYFESKGYKVSKARNIHYDWLAERAGREYLVECKLTTARLSSAQVDFFAECLKKGKHYIIARRKENGRIELKRH